MTAPNKMAKRAAAGTLALAVCFTGGLVAASTASADATFKFDQRFGGADRFETAVNASKAAFADGAGDVIIVQDDALADGLTASYLAGLKKAPILYVKKDSVPAATSAELDRLKAERIFIVGGTAVVSSSVQSSLGSNGRNVTRVSGSDRFETAARVATSGSNDVGTVFIANGDAPADALAAGPIAYKSSNPILLTRSMDVPSSTAAALRQLNETNRIVVGGNAVVSTSTYTELDANNRLAGKNRQGTAVAIADYAVDNEGFNRANAALVGPEDRNTADALIAAPFAGQTGTPILFTARDGISDETTQYLKDNAAGLTGEGYIFGGTSAVSDADASAATAAAGGDGITPPPVDPPTTPPAAGSIAVATTDATSQVLQSDDGTQSQTDRDDNRIYTATALKDGVEYRISLVDSKNVKVTGTTATFLSSSDPTATSKFSADLGVDYADIVKVNGAAPAFAALDTESRTVTATPVGGKITFEIDGAVVGSVTPVVYLNGGPGRTDAEGGLSTRLETSAKDVGEFAAPTETYGLGGTATYIGGTAENGAFTGGVVASVDKSTNSFSTEDDGTNPSVRYTFDDNDTFTVGGTSVDLAAFKAQLSSGDGIGGTFAQDASGNSTFDLTDDNPVTPTVTSATRSSGSTSSVTILGNVASTIRDVDQLVIQRAPVSATDPGDVGGFNTVATIAAVDITPDTPASVDFRYVDQNVPAGNYQYRVASINDSDQSVPSTASGTAAVSAGAPTLLDTRIQVNDNTSPFLLNTGDSFTLVSSADLKEPDAAAALQVMDSDGTIATITRGVNNTFTLNANPVVVGGVTYPARRVITVVLGADPVPDGTAVGDAAGVAIGATITKQAGITDDGGSKLLLTGDAIIDEEN